MSFNQNVEILGCPAIAHQCTVGAASAYTQLSPNVYRISMRAVGADVRYKITPVAATASATTSHFIADGERLDLAVGSANYVSYIRDASTDGVLEVTELV